MARSSATKLFLFIASLVLILVGLFTSCAKRSTDPTNRNYEKSYDSTATDTSTGGPVATFNEPTGIAVDASGNIYVADYGNNTIRKISTAGIVTTLAGNGSAGALNGPDSLATFNGPTSVAVDPSGNVYVADDNNNQIRLIATNGMVSTLAGSDSTSAQNGMGASAYFFGPAGVACDGQGNVYVADAGNNLIRMVTPGGLVSTITGNINPGAQNGPDSTATFNNPTGLAVDGSGNIYVADMLNSLIREISGGQVTTLAGGDTSASINGMGTSADFFFPNSLAVDGSGNVYVTEYISNLIRKITPNGTVTTFAGSGASGQADSTGTAASFSGPSGVAVDGAGNVYVADTYNNVIRKITPLGAVTTIAGTGMAGSTNGKALSLHKTKTLALLHKRIRPGNNVLFRILVKRPAMQYYLRINR